VGDRGQSQLVRVRRGLQLVLGLLWLSLCGQAVGQTFNAADFFTPRVGDSWTYELNGSQSVTLQTTRTELIDTTQTFVTHWTGGPEDGLDGYSSFDDVLGARIWKSFAPSLFIDGVGFVSQLIVYDPPLVSALPTFTLGQIVESKGTVTQTLATSSNSVVQPGTVDATYRYALVEPVTVPFGSFNAIQRQIQLDLKLEVTPGVFNSVTATSRDWLVPGLGSVRIEQTFPDHTDTYVLVNTNRQVIPEPSELMLSAGASAVLLLLRGRKRIARTVSRANPRVRLR